MTNLSAYSAKFLLNYVHTGQVIPQDVDRDAISN